MKFFLRSLLAIIAIGLCACFFSAVAEEVSDHAAVASLLPVSTLNHDRTRFPAQALRSVADKLNLRASGSKQRSLFTPANAASSFNIIDAVPRPESKDFPVDGLIALRFSLPLNADLINADTLTLLGPSGVVELHRLISDDREVIFLRPMRDLLPAARYTLFITGAQAESGEVLPFIALSFSTDSLLQHEDGTNVNQNRKAEAEIDADETWTPGPENYGGRWRTGRPLPKHIAKLTNERLSRNSMSAEERNNAALFNKGSGVFGQVFKLNDRPLTNVIVSVGAISTRTDENGVFELFGLATGRHELVVDGRTASTAEKEYAQFVIGIDIQAGKMTAQPPIYLPRIRATDWVQIPSPLDHELTISYPSLPGMSLRIPKGAVLRDREGKILTRIALVPMPLDRLPFMVPENFPSYFSVQPGGFTVENLSPAAGQGIRVYYRNIVNQPPGRIADLWNYDPKELGWHVYGLGRVSSDGAQIEPDPGVAIYQSTGFGIDFAPDPGPQPSPPPCDNPGCCGSGGGGGGGGDGPKDGPCTDGDPVDTKTGLFMHTRTDLSISDIMPINLTRTYRPDQSVTPLERPFGKGTTHPYAMYLYALRAERFVSPKLVLQDGSEFSFTRLSPPGTDFDERIIFESTATPGRFYKARITYSATPGHRWILTLRDGTRFVFSAIVGGTTAGRLIGMYDRFSNFLEVTRSGGLVTRLTTLSGRWIDFTYDANNRIERLEDIGGRQVRYEYYPSGHNQGWLWKVTDPENYTEEYEYYSAPHPPGRMWKVKDKRGNIMVTNEYYTSGPNNGRIQRQTLADNGIYEFAYTNGAGGEVIQTDVTDPRGYVRQITYHASGYPATDTYAVGQAEQQTMTYTRQPSGLVTVEVDQLGRRTEYEYDDRGNRRLIRRLAHRPVAEHVIEQFTYTTDFNQIETYTNPLNKVWTYRYFPNSTLREIEDPLRNVTRFTYTANGQIKTVTNPINKTTVFDYDLYDLRTVTDPLNHTTTTFTDVLGRVRSTRNHLGEIHLTEYDRRSLVRKQTDPLQQETVFTYDQNGNLTVLRDARLAETVFGYDAKNRLESRTDPLLKTEYFLYDKMNNLEVQLDRKGQYTLYQYDPLNRRKLAYFQDDSLTTYEYDAGNRLRVINDSQSGTISRDFDDLDRLKYEITPQGRIDYSYDKASRRETMQVAGQPQVTYGFDDANRLRNITQGSNQVQLGYDDASRQTSIRLPNGIDMIYRYDDANRLEEIQYRQGATTLGNLSYNYDEANRRTGAGGSFARTRLPTAMDLAEYDPANRLTAWEGRTLEYDDNGNLLNDGLRTYTWDARNRLTEITGPVNASFVYDPLGRRISKAIGGATTQYLHDGLNPVQEQDNKGTPTANLLTGLGIDQFFSRSDSVGARHFLTDALGTVLALTDNTGAIKTEYTYSPYGEVTMNGELNSNPFQYTGRENDGTGLYYYRARYYDPLTSRFVAEDPIGFEGGINTYLYTHGNPINYIDPEGLNDSSCGPEDCAKKCAKLRIRKLILACVVVCSVLSGDPPRPRPDPPVTPRNPPPTAPAPPPGKPKDPPPKPKEPPTNS